MKGLFKTISVISKKSKADYLNAFAAEASLFIIMSFIPCLILLMLIVKYTPLTEEMILTVVSNAFPTAFVPAIQKSIHTVYNDVNTTMLFITIISILWAAGKGFVSLIDGLNSVYAIKEHRNWIVLRLYSILYTLIFLVIIASCIVIYVLGYRINEIIERKAPFVANITNVILQFRAFIMVLLLTMLFTFLYVLIPNRRTKIKRQIPGAMFSAIGWVGFSFFFSIYAKYSNKISFIYGSLTTIILVMLWLYVCMYIFLIGAEVNLYIEEFSVNNSIQAATNITHNANPDTNVSKSGSSD